MSTDNDGFGWDKAARNEAENEALAAAKKPPPLQPAFPYLAMPFDPVFFGIQADPEGLESDD